jgi:hypothetical protein
MLLELVHYEYIESQTVEMEGMKNCLYYSSQQVFGSRTWSPQVTSQMQEEDLADLLICYSITFT